MYRKLRRFRIRQAAINIGSMGMILLVIFSLFYFFFETALRTQELGLLRNTAEIAAHGGGAQALAHDAADEQFMLFYVSTDLSGYILSYSTNAMGRRDFLAALLENTDRLAYQGGALENAHGDVELTDARFAYLVTEKPDGRVYVFISTETRDELLRLYIFIAAGGLITALAGVFFISMYLASRAIVPIRASMETQDKFIADASHELRTPLALIRSNVEMIMDEPGMSVCDNMKWLEFILKESKRMAKITEDLLMLSKADSRRAPAEKADGDLSALVSGVYDSFGKLFKEHGLHENASRIEPGVRVHMNENEIRQLLTVLLDNAIKYTREGGVTIALEQDSGHAYIKVRDTGQGVPEDMREKIFERFVRIDKARSRAGHLGSSGGAGLGLSIAKAIAEDHGGSISVSSEPGKGSEFCVTLPRAGGA